MIPQNSIAFTPRRAALLAGGAALLLLLSYSVYAALPFLEGPYLSVSIREGTAGIAVIEGKTARISYVQLNGMDIAVNEDGSFTVERAFPAGYTESIVAAKDRFGREITKTLTFVNTHG